MFEMNRAAGIVNQGNDARLQNAMRRASVGGKLTIGFLGGSITQGSLSSTPQTCYAYLVYSWWKENFPMADVSYVNAGIGATTSQFGAARVGEDLLSYKPDVVFLEFSVNDGSNAHFLETYEGLVRRVLSDETAPAVVLIYNVCYDNGASAQLMHAKVGRHYDLPGISMQSSIYPELLAGRIENRAITPDDLHPNDAGHELVASVITCYLETVRERMEASGGQNRAVCENHSSVYVENANVTDPADGLPAPLTANTYEHSIRYNNKNGIPVEVEGFAKDTREQNGSTDIFKNGWEASAQGAHIVFSLEGTGVSVQFRRSVNQPAPVAEILVDDDPATRTILDANFDETWGDKLDLLTVTEHMPEGTHRIEVRLIETHEDDAVPFYLNAVLMAD
ncbi:MAG: SGNH/GDSL hydrolase family protein [Lachnospiraceae bacterium]|nr:SGNH/GDSL hydrolase family protein [Lachnospiraceae bacterium]